MLRTIFSRFHIRILFLILISVAPAFWVIAYNSIEQRAKAHSAARLQALGVARDLAARERDFVVQSHQLLNNLARSPEARGLTSPRACNELLADTGRLHRDYVDLLVASPDGNVRCSANAIGHVLNVADRAYFRRALDARDFAIGDFQISRITRRQNIAFARPVFDSAGDIQAVVAVGVDPTRFNAYLTDISLPAGSVITLLDSNGIILARIPEQAGSMGRAIPELRQFKDFIAANKQAVMELPWADGVRRITGFAPVSGAAGDIYVRVGIPTESVYADVERAYNRNLIQLSAAALLALALGWFAGNRLIVRRVDDLLHTAKRLGRGNLSARTTLAPDHSELGRLARTLNEMADGLQTLHTALQFQAQHDALTQLPNRTLLQDRLSQAIANSSRRASTIWVAFIDLDRFKVVNDSFGHKAGDLYLKQIAARLASAVRQTDTVARLGGDEFVLILPERTDGTTHPLSASAMQRILDTVEQPLIIEGHEFFPSCSIGVAVYPTDGDDAESLMTHADIAMFRAKEMGRNNFQFYASAMHEKTLERLHLEGELRHALERDELVVHYQPQVDLITGHITGMEALIRWQHPELGLVPPDRFIDLAEESGMIVPIGAWVLRTACAQNVRWQRVGLGRLRVAVNLSARQFDQQDLVKSVRAVLDETGLAASDLEIELTESMVMTNVERAIGALRDLKATGVQLSIDDFGTGYSSLAYLKRFPIDALKIDRSFVRDITVSSDDAAIVTAIIALAHSLKLHVIAEGVETEQQARYLRHHGCDVMQGYYFCKPVPAAAFEEMLRKGKTLMTELDNAA